MSEHRSYREESRLDYGTREEGVMNREQVGLGALLRIADSLEKMEKPYVKLMEDLEWYRDRTTSYQQEVQRLANVNAGLRGQITKLKKQIKN